MYGMVISGKTHEAVKIAAGEGNFKYAFLYKLKNFVFAKSENDLPAKNSNNKKHKTPPSAEDEGPPCRQCIHPHPHCLKLPELLLTVKEDKHRPLVFSIIVFINWLYRLKCIVKTKKETYIAKGCFLANIRKT